MRPFLSLAVALALTLPFAGNLHAQAATDPVGFTTVACPANSDTLLSVPFTRLPEFIGAISSVSANTITVSGTPWSASQFVYNPGNNPPQHNTYFVLIGPHASSNPNEGRTYLVTANTTNTLTLNLNGDSISGVQPSTQILVIPYVTLASLFPASDANVSFIPSASQFNLQTQIFIPNVAATGINQSTGTTYYYSNNAWRKFGFPAEVHDDDVLQPLNYFTLRNAATATTLTSLGSVLTKKETLPLHTNASTQQDNFVSIIRPIDVKLNDLGLITSGAFASSASQFNLVDQLFVFNNAATGINKSASATYYYSNSAWRKFGFPNTDAGNDTIPAGAGFVIRKGATGNGLTQFWQNTPTY